MTNPNDDNYFNKLLTEEFGVPHSFPSTGQLEKDYDNLKEVAIRQDKIIKLLHKQKDPGEFTGFRKQYIEFQNTIWRLVIGYNEKQYERIIQENEFLEQRENFEKFYFTLKNSTKSQSNNLPGRLFIDVTSTSRTKFLSGIQRVVNEITHSLAGPNVYPLFVATTGAFTINKSTEFLDKVIFEKNDVLLMPDAALDHALPLKIAMSENSAAGGINVSVVYDTIPLSYPLTCGAAVPYKFHHWLKSCVYPSDLILCNTAAVVSQVKNLFEQYHHCEQKSPDIEFFPLASEVGSVGDRKHSNKLSPLIENSEKIFLSVGTIEPRKGYAITIDAAEQAWRMEADFIYVIVGRYGWGQTSIRDRILNHIEYGKRLFWLENIDDDDLSTLYKRSRALIFSSIDEGYGLPLIEAAFYGLPAIVSDIPVFREIANDQAIYFERANSSMLAEAINTCCRQPKEPPNIKIPTWADSASRILEHIYRVLDKHAK
jgi:glycosyltransferase involved in cell wall biosynthesis